MGNHHQWIFREWVQKYSKDGSFGSRRVLCLFFWPTEKPCLLEIYRGRTGTWSPTVSTSGPHLFDLSPPNPLLLLPQGAFLWHLIGILRFFPFECMSFRAAFCWNILWQNLCICMYIVYVFLSFYLYAYKLLALSGFFYACFWRMFREPCWINIFHNIYACP